jgi:3-dehydroquinate synthetase
VERDPLDTKRGREVLNFGHTAGHAMEAAAQGKLSHGESVIWGMAVETTLLGARGDEMTREIGRVIAAMGLQIPELLRTTDEATWLEWLSGDKKMKDGKLELSLLTKPGKKIKIRCDAERIARALRAFPGSWRLEA